MSEKPGFDFASSSKSALYVASIFILAQCGQKTSTNVTGSDQNLQITGTSQTIPLSSSATIPMIGSKQNLTTMDSISPPVGAEGTMRYEMPTSGRILGQVVPASTPAATPTPTPFNVTMRRYDTSNSGLNPNETILTPTNVTSSTFGLLFQAPVDGQVYAQPLYLSNIYVMGPSGLGYHNVVFIATENDSLYAIDADTGTQLWSDHFLVNSGGYSAIPVPYTDTDALNIVPNIGITGTPVIDTSTGTLYVVTKVKKYNATGSDIRYVQELHALDITAGAEKFGGPTVIADTSFNSGTYTQNAGPSVAGTASGAVNGVIPFNSLRQNQRGNLILSQGNIIITFASYGDVDPYQGWILSYSASTLALNGVFNDNPNGAFGGFWQSGGGVTVDSTGNIYASSGNGTFDTTLNAAGFPSSGDYGDAVVKLVTDPTTSATSPGPNGWGLKVTDYFSPYYQAMLDSNDYDLGCGGVVLLPDSAGITNHPHLMIAIGKNGTIYTLDRDNLGKFFPSSDNVIQEFQSTSSLKSWSNALFFDSQLFFFGTTGFKATTPTSAGQVYSYANGQFNTTAVTLTPDLFSYPGSTPVLSSNQGTSAVLWATEFSTGQLRAYDPTNPGTELYTSAQAGTRDAISNTVKFNPPMVANGKVYVGTFDSVAVFGLLSDANSSDVKEKPASRDFNGDHMSDIALRQSSSGDMVTWLMDADQFYQQEVLPTVTDTTWAVQGAGNFLGGLTAGLLWRNTTSGEMVVWAMQGGSFSSQIGLPTVANLQWVIQGTGDFNGDGTADILWRNSQTGQLVVWTMQNGKFSSQIAVPTVSNLAWVIKGVGDFNGDGTADILWYNSTTGQIVIWTMKNGTFSTQLALPEVPTAQGWAISGVGDFNGDGTSDILWYNSGSGSVVIWTISAGKFLAQTAQPAVAASTNWSIIQTGDYDGSGNSDVLWRNSSSGLMVNWNIRNGNFVQQLNLPSTSNSTWSPQ